jgi:hypothetical protein
MWQDSVLTKHFKERDLHPPLPFEKVGQNRDFKIFTLIGFKGPVKCDQPQQ